MKKILNALFLTLLAVFTFSSCSDVPAPYDILGEGDVPGLTGDGTKENPYNVTSAQKKQDGSTAWVQGYIVGTIENYSDPSGSATFKAPFTAKNNLLIAASATETDVKNCVVVQLSSGTILYTNLNLPENTTNLGHIISIQGSLEEFYGFPGVKSTTAATLDGKDVGEGGDVDSDNPLGLDDSNPVNSFSATFDDAVNNNDYILANWYNVAITGGRRWQGKIFNETDKYIQATSYNATGSNFECWFVTPAFKVDEIKDKTVSFKCAVYNYAIASANSNLEVYFLKLVNGKMESNKLTIEGMPTTDNTWVSLNANLNDYAGQTGFVGFKYTSTSKTEALSYRLDDIQAGKGEGGGETPGEGTELLTNGGFEDWVDGYPVEWKSASSAGNATLEQSTDKRGGSFAVLVKGDPENNKRLGSTEITLKAGTYIFSAYFKAATADNASARLGYVPIDETGKVGNYLYDDYVNDITNSEWVTKNYTFKLDKEQKICLVVMNPKSPGKDLLVDDVSLKTEDGGIVGGETEPEPGNKVYTSNIALPEGTSTDPNKASGGKVIIEEQEYPILKLGTGSVIGSWNSLALQAGASKLSFFAVGWTGKTGQLTVVIENGGTFEGGTTSKVISLDGSTAGAAGNSPFTITPVDTDFYEYALTGITASSTIKFTTDGAPSDKRAIIFGINIK